MTGSYLDVSYWQVAGAAGLVVINGAISLLLRLQLERQLVIASVRMIVQLLLIGLILHWVFALDAVYGVLSLMVVMTLVAGGSAVERTRNRYPGIWFNSIVSVWASSWLVTGFALFG